MSETLTSMEFPRLYLAKPITAQELRSKVEGVSITKISNDYPNLLLKFGTAGELRSKFTLPPIITWEDFMEEWA